MVYQRGRKQRGDEDDDEEEKEEEEDDNDKAAREEDRRETQVSSGQMAITRARVFPPQRLRRGEEGEKRGRGRESLTYGARPRERRSAGLLLPLPSLPSSSPSSAAPEF